MQFEEKEKLHAHKSRYENLEEVDKIAAVEVKLKDVDNRIADICAAKNKKIAEDYLLHASDGIDGIKQPKIWKLKNLLAPKISVDPPSSKLDKNGNLVTNLKHL